MVKNHKQIKDVIIIAKTRPLIQNDVYSKSIYDEDSKKMHAWNDLSKQKSGVENRGIGITGSIFGNQVKIYCSGCEFAQVNFNTGSIFQTGSIF